MALYFASRLVALNSIPIFIDEAIHIDWARPSALTLMPPDPSFDGKWLSIKLFGLVMRLPGLNSVLATRLLVAILGLAAALAIYLIGRELYSRIAGAIGALIYVVLPFTVIYNSLALCDGVQLAFGAWAIFAAVRVVRSDRWGWAAIALPLLLVATILSKFSAVVLLMLPVMTVLLLLPPAKWPRGLMRIAPALVTATGLVAWLYARGLLEVFKTKAASDRLAVITLPWQNLIIAGEWFWGLLTPIIMILAIVSFAWELACRRNRETWFLAGLWCLNVVPYLLVAETWYPRYLLLAVIPIVLAIGAAISRVVALWDLGKRSPDRRVGVVLAILVLSILIWPAVRSGYVLFDLPDATLPRIEQYQLVRGTPAGYGTAELVEFLRAQAQATQGGITVARTSFLDHPMQTLNIYLPSESLSLFNLGKPGDERTLALMSLQRRVLLVLATDNGAPERFRSPSLALMKCGQPIWSYTKPKGTTGFVVYDLRCDENQIRALD